MRHWSLVDAQTYAEIDSLEGEIRRYLRGELTVDELRPLRTIYGVYGQRHKDRYMLRVKLPQGLLNDQQLETLGEIARNYSRGFAYVTTRQDIQYHFLLLPEVPAALRRLADVGLTTREAGGNIVRNVTCDPLAGVCPQEVFDVTPYSHAVSRHFLRNPVSQGLPRKIKIAFSGCPHDHAFTPIHDIGAQAVIRDGQRGFRLLVGGGLGAVPRLAELFEDFVPEEELLPLCEAIIRVFNRTGERKNRNKARLKFVLARLGLEEFRRLVYQERSALPVVGNGAYPQPDLSLEEGPPHYAQATASPAREGFPLWQETNVRPQKQAGYCVVQVALPVGKITADQFMALAEISRRYCGGSVRTTIGQNLLLRWVRQADLPGLHAALDAAGLARPGPETIIDPVACPGTETCMSALTHSKGLARALIEELGSDGHLLDPFVRAIRIKVSGCPNACGHHHAADIGLYGCALHVDGRLIPAYQLLVGGGDGDALARPVMRIAARRVPAAISALVNHYRQVREEGESFRQFVRRLGTDYLRQALADCGRMPTFVEDPPAYVDWEGDKLFSLEERGEGECAV